MKKTINSGDNNISYELTYKNVKNINLRIGSDGIVKVSANPFVPVGVIERFILSKQDFIIDTLNKLNNRPIPTQYYTQSQIKSVILDICKSVYPYYENRGVKFPEIKFRPMTSCWGNCRSVKGILTFNTNLMYAPLECIEYVVFHEFTHFLQSNHSKKFYEELSVVCPDWKDKRKMLKEIRI